MSAASVRGDRAELDFLSDSDPLWDDVAAWSETCLGSACEDYDLLFPHASMRQEAAGADILIVNHHLLLADAAPEGRQSLPGHSCRTRRLILERSARYWRTAGRTDFFGTEIGNCGSERLVRTTSEEWRAAAAGDPTISHAPHHPAGRGVGALLPLL